MKVSEHLRQAAPTESRFVTLGAHRNVQVWRGEKGTLRVELIPIKESEEPEEVERAIKSLTGTDFSISRSSGEVSLRERWLKQFFEARVVEEDWEYDGGEASTSSEEYDSSLKLINRR
jgi:hypothetical protein